MRPPISNLSDSVGRSDWPSTCFIINNELRMRLMETAIADIRQRFQRIKVLSDRSMVANNQRVRKWSSKTRNGCRTCRHETNLPFHRDSADVASDYAALSATKHVQYVTNATRVVAHVGATRFLQYGMRMLQGNRSCFPKATPNLSRHRSVDRYCN